MYSSKQKTERRRRASPSSLTDYEYYTREGVKVERAAQVGPVVKAGLAWTGSDGGESCIWAEEQDQTGENPACIWAEECVCGVPDSRWTLDNIGIISVRVAQWIGRLPSKQKIPGSSPGMDFFPTYIFIRQGSVYLRTYNTFKYINTKERSIFFCERTVRSVRRAQWSIETRDVQVQQYLDSGLSFCHEYATKTQEGLEVLRYIQARKL